MDTVFLKILNMSLNAGLLILAVLPIRLLMKKAPKWTVCLLWLMVAVALICPVRFESPASVLPTSEPIVITSDKLQTNEGPLPNIQETPILVQDIIEQNTAPIHTDYLAIGSTVWCIGMLILLAYALFSWLRLKKEVSASIEIQKHTFLCDNIDTPFILGILRPRIYLPSALDEDTTAQVLLHEQAHLARKDHWWKPLGFLLLSLHWFNPLVWLAYSLLCTDIELACDEKVIKDMTPESKKRYLEALLNCSVPRRLITICPLAFGEVSVKQRIAAVLHYKKPALWIILAAIAVCVALCFGFLTKPVENDTHAEPPASITLDTPTPAPEDSPMDSSFDGQEALYNAIKTDSLLPLQKENPIILIGTKILDGANYAMIHAPEARFDNAFLVEYAANPDGTVSILNHHKGTTAESYGNYGYAMNFAQLSGKSLYWTTFRARRWATTADGKEIDTTKTVPTDYTGFRFLWADLHHIDYPADDSFFLADVDSVVPPAIVIPITGNTPLPALGLKLP